MSASTSKSPPGIFTGGGSRWKPAEGAAFPAAGRGLPWLPPNKNWYSHVQGNAVLLLTPFTTGPTGFKDWKLHKAAPHGMPGSDVQDTVTSVWPADQ